MQDDPTHMHTLLTAVETCLVKRLPFAVYRLPGKQDITLVVQCGQPAVVVEEMITNFPVRGFLIAPFSRQNGKTYLIRPDLVFRNFVPSALQKALEELPDGPDLLHTTIAPDDTRKEDYFIQVEDIISGIGRKEFEKVVLSRVKSVKGHYLTQITRIFHLLGTAYPDAFVYLFHVEGNCWTGATTEPLVCSDSGRLNTVSLAGTRPYSAENMDVRQWNQKEIHEQDFVTRHIEGVLMDFEVEGYSKNGPFAVRAGNLAHLCTDFVFTLPEGRLPSLLAALHPTPAVCGMDSCSAFDFIRHTEAHSREYYTGFLGPVGIDDQLQLYVNLRCMKVLHDRLVMYVGGGITHDSRAADEWEETEIKADTLLSVLRSLQ